MTIVYGIKNCDTVRKARKWLDAAGVDYHFHDFRNDGIDAERIQQWLQVTGHSTLINKRSTTWKNLSLDEQNQAADARAADLLVKYPTLIKRPVTISSSKPTEVIVGFKPEQFAQHFS